MSGKLSERLHKAYNARSSTELLKIYDTWADDFDRDTEVRGSRQPAFVCGLVARHVCIDSGTILDVGAGTGQIGEFLRVFGYRDIVGIDFSEAVLRIASEKNCYCELHRATLGEPLEFPDDTFASVVSAGVFTKGHAPPSSFDEMIRVAKPGGYLIFSVNQSVYLNGFKERQWQLEKDRKWSLVEKTGPSSIMPIFEPDNKARLFVYRAC